MHPGQSEQKLVSGQTEHLTWGLSRLPGGRGDSSRASLGTEASARANSSCALPLRSWRGGEDVLLGLLGSSRTTRGM